MIDAVGVIGVNVVVCRVRLVTIVNLTVAIVVTMIDAIGVIGVNVVVVVNMDVVVVRQFYVVVVHVGGFGRRHRGQFLEFFGGVFNVYAKNCLSSQSCCKKLL